MDIIPFLMKTAAKHCTWSEQQLLQCINEMQYLISPGNVWYNNPTTIAIMKQASLKKRNHRKSTLTSH